MQDAAIGLQRWVFVAFLLAFAIKVPMFPFHTWLPDAHVEAPTGGSVLLAGVLLKMGAYGFLRFMLPMTPDAVADVRGLLVALSVVAIIYGALVAMVQPDLKKLIAYSSVSHMGFVTLGIFSGSQTGIDGAIILMMSHGLVNWRTIPRRGRRLRPGAHAADRRHGRPRDPHARLCRRTRHSSRSRR